MIRKVYEIDSLLCLKCRGEMKVIGFIEDQAVIDKIIDRLKPSFQAGRPLHPISENPLDFTQRLNVYVYFTKMVRLLVSGNNRYP